MPEAYQATAVYPAMRHRATEAPSLTTDAAYYSNIVMDTSSQTNQESTGDYDHYDRLDEYEGPVTNAESRRPLPATPTVYERPYRASTNAEIHRPLPPPPPPPVYDCLVRWLQNDTLPFNVWHCIHNVQRHIFVGHCTVIPWGRGIPEILDYVLGTSNFVTTNPVRLSVTNFGIPLIFNTGGNPVSIPLCGVRMLAFTHPFSFPSHAISTFSIFVNFPFIHFPSLSLQPTTPFLSFLLSSVLSLRPFQLLIKIFFQTQLPLSATSISFISPPFPQNLLFRFLIPFILPFLLPFARKFSLKSYSWNLWAFSG